jgi:hypothetical protein
MSTSKNFIFCLENTGAVRNNKNNLIHYQARGSSYAYSQNNSRRVNSPLLVYIILF